MLTKHQVNKLLKDNKIDELIYLIQNTHYNEIPYNIIYNYLRKNPNYELKMIINRKYYKCPKGINKAGYGQYRYYIAWLYPPAKGSACEICSSFNGLCIYV